MELLTTATYLIKTEKSIHQKHQIFDFVRKANCTTFRIE